MNTLKLAFENRGMTLKAAVEMGANYQTLWKQFRNDRRVGPKTALNIVSTVSYNSME